MFVGARLLPRKEKWREGEAEGGGRRLVLASSSQERPTRGLTHMPGHARRGSSVTFGPFDFFRLVTRSHVPGAVSQSLSLCFYWDGKRETALQGFLLDKTRHNLELSSPK